MILILSETDDESTDEVIDWLNFFGAVYLRINPSDTDSIHNHYHTDNYTEESYIYIKNNIIDVNTIDSVWYRRGGIKRLERKFSSILIEANLEKEIILANHREYKVITEYLIYLLGQKSAIGSYSKYSVNKIKCLNFAKSVGLNIPATIITTKKNLLKEFKEKYKEIINKAIYESFHYVDQDKMYHTYTEIVDDSFIENLSPNFQPACFQEKLNKQFEIRTFFLDGMSYSMAIFSQQDDQTKIDFRKYNKKKPNVTVPFNLPREISDKLAKFMSKINLNCGSFDLVYTVEKKFVFLEVNPIGQYNMVSVPCNYYLDELIAKKLISLTKKSRPNG